MDPRACDGNPAVTQVGLRRERRTVSFVLRCFLLLPVLLSAAWGQTWTQVWSDEFDDPAGTPINAAKWQFDRGNLNVNNELEFYCAPSDASPCDASHPNAYTDGSGHLVIQAVRLSSATAPGSNSWSSARLNGGNGLANFQYGRIESRMQLPVGPGIWPAFWALGSNIATVSWPASGEMDFMENIPASAGMGPNIVRSTVHGPGYSGSNGIGQNFTLPNGGSVTAFHTYGAIWSPFMVQFYVDDPANVFFILTARDLPAGTQWAFNHPFFLLVNLAVGGTGSWPGPPDGTTPSPAPMLVDYVRVYQAVTVPVPHLGTSASVTVKAGGIGSTMLNLGSTAGTGRVYLACSVDAPKTTCAVSTGNALNSSVVDFSAATTASATVSVTTTANTAAAAPARLAGGGALWLPGIPLLLGFATGAAARHSSGSWRRAARFAVMAGTVLLSVACGGGASPPPPGGGTPPGSYHITVNAYTVSSDPANPATYGSAVVPLTVN